MSSSDFAELAGSLRNEDDPPDSGNREIIRGPTYGLGGPPGTAFGQAVLAARCLPGATGAWGLRDDHNAPIVPCAAGGSATVVMRRGYGAAFAAGAAPFLFVGLQASSVASAAYLLGLSDGANGRVALVKGTPLGGIPDVAPGTLGVLRRSTATRAPGAWVHLRLDVIVNPGGDVLLQAFENDLERHALGSEQWDPIDGIEEVNDDTLYVATGSAPLIGGYIGFGARLATAGALVTFDYFTARAQT